jgi:hypothetical protein
MTRTPPGSGDEAIAIAFEGAVLIGASLSYAGGSLASRAAFLIFPMHYFLDPKKDEDNSRQDDSQHGFESPTRYARR